MMDRMRLFNMLLAELPACLIVRNGEDVQIGVDPEKLMALVDRILQGENHDDGTG
jgi:hypothetical protein